MYTCDCVQKIKSDLAKKYTVNGIEAKIGLYGVASHSNVWAEIWDVYLNRYKKSKIIEIEHKFCPFCGEPIKQTAPEEINEQDLVMSKKEALETAEYDDKLKTHVTGAGFPTMAANALWRNGYNTVNDVINMTDDQIRRVRYIGKIMRHRILNRLKELDIIPKWSNF